jgi:hypothetical protein
MGTTMTTDRRPRHPAAVARVLVAGVAGAATFGLMAGMAATPVPPAAVVTSVEVPAPGGDAPVTAAPGDAVRRLETGIPARPAPGDADRVPVRSRTRGS